MNIKSRSRHYPSRWAATAADVSEAESMHQQLHNANREVERVTRANGAVPVSAHAQSIDQSTLTGVLGRKHFLLIP